MTEQERLELRQRFAESRANYHQARERKALDAAWGQVMARLPFIILFIVLLIAVL
jgi:hypothetical protein